MFYIFHGNDAHSIEKTLDGLQASTGIQFDKASGAYWFAYLDQNDTQRTVYLENAASIAAMILTTEALITDRPSKNGRSPSSQAAGYDDYDF